MPGKGAKGGSAPPVLNEQGQGETPGISRHKHVTSSSIDLVSPYILFITLKEAFFGTYICNISVSKFSNALINFFDCIIFEHISTHSFWGQALDSANYYSQYKEGTTEKP